MFSYEHDVDMSSFVSNNAIIWFLLHTRMSLPYLVVLLRSSLLVILGALGQCLIDQGLVIAALS